MTPEQIKAMRIEKRASQVLDTLRMLGELDADTRDAVLIYVEQQLETKRLDTLAFALRSMSYAPYQLMKLADGKDGL